MMSSRQLRKRARPNYKEPSESDIYLSAECASPYRLPKSSRPQPLTSLYPIEILEEDTTKYKVHYIGYSSKHDEWKDKEDVVNLDDDPVTEAEALSLNYELASKIKSSLNSSRKDSPVVKILMPFGKADFDTGLKVCGKTKTVTHGVERYTVQRYQDLDELLGKNWHYRGINDNGDFCYAILETIEFYIYRRRAIQEYTPFMNSSGTIIPEKKHRNTGYMLAFCFVRSNGTPDRFWL